MPRFEVINTAVVNSQLRVEIGPGAGCMSSDPADHDTAMYLKPPLLETEHETLKGEFSTETPVGRLLAGNPEKNSAWTKFTVDWAPDAEIVETGRELTQAVMALRGTRAAMLVTDLWRPGSPEGNDEHELTEEIILMSDDVVVDDRNTAA